MQKRCLNSIVQLQTLCDEPHAAEDPRAIQVANETLKVHPVPVILWSNGHVAFIQRTPWQLGVVPFVIHTTFQRFGREGKRGRLR